MTPALILSLVSIMAGVLQNNPQIPQGVSQAIKDASTSLAAMFAALMSRQDNRLQLNPTTIIMAIGSIITSLKTDPNLPQEILTTLESIDQALQRALLADNMAKQVVDYSTLHQIAPLSTAIPAGQVGPAPTAIPAPITGHTP